MIRRGYGTVGHIDLTNAAELVSEGGAKRVAQEMPEVFIKFHKGYKYDLFDFIK
jgi:hypothetical protein